MTILKAITRANELRPNDIPDEHKAEWLNALEGEIADLMRLQPPPNIWPDDRPLLMPTPYDDFYPLWIAAMIDNEQQDMTLYTNDMQMANEAYKRARAWWRRNHRADPHWPPFHCERRDGEWNPLTTD